MLNSMLFPHDDVSSSTHTPNPTRGGQSLPRRLLGAVAGFIRFFLPLTALAVGFTPVSLVPKQLASPLGHHKREGQGQEGGGGLRCIALYGYSTPFAHYKTQVNSSPLADLLPSSS